MIKFAQYENLFSLYLILLALLPTVILCFFRRKSVLLDLVTSFILILVFLGVGSLQLLEFFLFLAFETALVFAFLIFRKRCSSELVYYFIFLLSLLPLFVVRIAVFKPSASRLIGFTGISYMCFKIWQVLFEIHDGKITSLNLLRFLLFLVFFPSFSSGPIARYQAFVVQYDKPCDDYPGEYFSFGFKKILLGLFYKFVVAYFINKTVLAQLPEAASFASVLAYMYGYTLYLFFDFAGYSHIAVGVGSLLGIRLPENFNKPFLACNMKEFWGRWHISLSTWFTDYVHGRFVLNNVRNGLFRSTKTASRCGLLFTMTLMGLWHGFSVHYLIYGLYQGILLVITDFWIRSSVYKRFKKKKAYPWISRAVCFQFISFGMLLFSGHYFFH